MKATSEDVLADLEARTRVNITYVAELQEVPLEALAYKENPASWNALECLEHLNLYGDFYLPEIRKRIQESSHQPDLYFKSGLLGNYFAESLLPKKKLNKMKTFKDKDPIGNKSLGVDTLHRFLEQQQQIIELLHEAKNVSLSKTKTAISISALIKLRLGDTFRVLVYHNQRHLDQASKVIAKAKEAVVTPS